MIGISKRREQRQVTRKYYHGELIPSPRDVVADVKRRVAKVQGFELVDLAGDWVEDETGRFWLYVLLFERDGTTLEAKAAIAKEAANDEGMGG